MAAKIYTDNAYTSRSEEAIGGNSVAFTSGALVSKVGGFLILTANAVRIDGISNGTKTVASDNQTVAKAKVSYTPTDKGTILVIAADDTLAQADEGKFYLINTSGQTVDVASATAYSSYIDTTSASATDAVVYMQVKLVKYVSDTASLFEIV